MKRLYLSIITAGLLFALPMTANAGSAPPVGQTVIREGDYAVELVKALRISTAESEADAENALASYGIAPSSGWISDFPVTPDIIAQVEASVDAARLPIGREDADKALLALNSELGLAVAPAAQAGGEEPEYAGQPTVIENYYYDEGPPVITYYAPPPDFAYLYAWDPFPFWCSGFFFPGFFVLADFDFAFFGRDDFRFRDRDDFRFFRDHHHWDGRAEITNHVTDPVTRRAVTVDPVSKRPLTRTAFRPVGARSFDPVAKTGGQHGSRIAGNIGSGGWSRTGGRSFDRTSAANIWNRSVSRDRGAALSRGDFRRNSGPSSGWGRGSLSGGRTFESRGGLGSFNRAPGVRSFNRERSFGQPSMSRGRTYGMPERAFGAPSRTFSSPGRSFAAPSMGGGFRGGGMSRGFSGGGRSFGGGFSGRSMGGGFGGYRR